MQLVVSKQLQIQNIKGIQPCREYNHYFSHAYAWLKNQVHVLLRINRTIGNHSSFLVTI